MAKRPTRVHGPASRFTDVSEEMGLAFAHQHNREGRFEDISDKAWIAQSRGSMGIAVADEDRDGDLDIVCTHWVGDVPALYRNGMERNGRLFFVDAASKTGIDLLPRDLVGWAAGFVDTTGSGDLDLLIINGHTNAARFEDATLAPQKGYLLTRKSRNGYAIRPPGTSPAEPFDEPLVGRSAAFSDLDHDGALDVLVGVNNGQARIWKGVRPPNEENAHWIEIELVGSVTNRDAVGSVLVLDPEGMKRLETVASGTSFFATSSRIRQFGLGSRTTPVTVEVRWPGGYRELFANLGVNRVHRLIEGSGS